ncbi:MAG: hypothetical protein AVO38_02800 [delta proteobacterium ML8_D]|nr:MAG: hypothetical protein AVO38_02800 [delta proteobacterium ML8_D]
MYARLKESLRNIAEKSGFMDSEVNITAKILTPEEAIGKTERKDFPLLQGKESLIQANFKNALGQAFTDTPRTFRGKLEKILELRLEDNGERALFIATLNALMRYLRIINDTVHCKEEEPELCAKKMVKTIIDKYTPDVKIGIIGFQPAIIDNFSCRLSAENLKVTDLDRDNINKIKYGVSIWDGEEMTEELFKTCDVILATGSTIVNNSLSQLISLSDRYIKPIYFYGITIAGASRFLNLKRLCFQSS